MLGCRRLTVTVLGVSTTAGCGASARCDAARGWAGQVHATIERLLADVGVSVETRVHYKNAVGWSHFGRCTSSFLREDTDVLMLELASNSWESAALINRTVGHLRRHYPHAVPILVNWYGPVEPLAHKVASKLHDVASARSCEVLDVRVGRPDWWSAAKRHAGAASPAVLAKLSRLSTQRYYFDHVHPSPLGHQLIGAVAAEHVLSNLRVPAGESEAKRDAPPPHKLECHARAAGAVEAESGEVCYPRADQLPAHWDRNGSTWALVDEGRAKGVKKLGLLSERVGDVIELVLPTQPCGMEVTLGFLASGRPGQGWLEISCGRCACVSKTGRATLGTSPFPLVPTGYRADQIQALGNASVTATTAFLAAQERRDMGCVVRITHRSGRRSRGATAVYSRVRIDSLYVRRAGFWERGSDPQTGGDQLEESRLPGGDGELRSSRPRQLKQCIVPRVPWGS